MSEPNQAPDAAYLIREAEKWSKKPEHENPVAAEAARIQIAIYEVGAAIVQRLERIAARLEAED